MTFDEVAGRILLFGGTNTGPGLLRLRRRLGVRWVAGATGAGAGDGADLLV